jgi:hypothetical protein
MTAHPSLFPLTLLDPVDASTQVSLMPGIDARCEAGLTADSCRWPYCCCLAPDRPPYERKDNA